MSAIGQDFLGLFLRNARPCWQTVCLPIGSRSPCWKNGGVHLHNGADGTARGPPVPITLPSQVHVEGKSASPFHFRNEVESTAPATTLNVVTKNKERLIFGQLKS